MTTPQTSKPTDPVTASGLASDLAALFGTMLREGRKQINPATGELVHVTMNAKDIEQLRAFITENGGKLEADTHIFDKVAEKIKKQRATLQPGPDAAELDEDDEQPAIKLRKAN